jgi:hypothetical protein
LIGYTQPMSYFLVVYDRRSGALDVTEYGEHDHERAMRDRLSRELAERGRPELEVVVLGAPSLDALKRTHSRYFSSVGELAQRALAVEL